MPRHYGQIVPEWLTSSHPAVAKLGHPEIGEARPCNSGLDLDDDAAFVSALAAAMPQPLGHRIRVCRAPKHLVSGFDLPDHGAAGALRSVRVSA